MRLLPYQARYEAETVEKVSRVARVLVLGEKRLKLAADVIQIVAAASLTGVTRRRDRVGLREIRVRPGARLAVAVSKGPAVRVARRADAALSDQIAHRVGSESGGRVAPVADGAFVARRPHHLIVAGDALLEYVEELRRFGVLQREMRA